jgi:hypothetical protein
VPGKLQREGTEIAERASDFHAAKANWQFDYW